MAGIHLKNRNVRVQTLTASDVESQTIDLKTTGLFTSEPERISSRVQPPVLDQTVRLPVSKPFLNTVAGPQAMKTSSA
jgi:hypothetical protein